MASFFTVVLILLCGAPFSKSQLRDFSDGLDIDDVLYEGWVDPFDMGMDPKPLAVRKLLKPDKEKAAEEEAAAVVKEEAAAVVKEEAAIAPEEEESIGDHVPQPALETTTADEAAHVQDVESLVSEVARLKEELQNERQKNVTTDHAATRRKETHRPEVSFLLRFVNILLINLKLTKHDEIEALPWIEELGGDANRRFLRFSTMLKISYNDMITLRRAAAAAVQDGNERPKGQRTKKEDAMNVLRDVDVILSSMMEWSAVHQPKDPISLLSEGVWLPNGEQAFWMVVLTFLITTLLMVVGGKLPLFRFLVVLFLVSTVWHWIRMYKEKVVEKHAALSKMDKDCWKMSRSWYELVFVNSEDPCVEYYRASMVDAWLEVPPTHAVAEIFSFMVFYPLEPLGQYVGKFFGSLLKETTWLSSPLVLVFVFAVTSMIVMMLFGYKVQFPFFMGSFEPSQSKDRGLFHHLQEENEILRKKLETFVIKPQLVHAGSAPCLGCRCGSGVEEVRKELVPEEPDAASAKSEEEDCPAICHSPAQNPEDATEVTAHTNVKEEQVCAVGSRAEKIDSKGQSNKEIFYEDDFEIIK